MNVTIYNPGNKNRESLINEFVVRTKVFDNIIRDIKTSKNIYPEQHYLIVGQRGAGKTTLLHRIKYAIEDDEKLRNIIPITLEEEQYGISELSNLWEKTAEVLEDYYGFSEIFEFEDVLDYEQRIFKKLEDALQVENKRIVLFIDNFGDLLNKFTEIEVKRLREVLMTSPYLRLIVSSPIMLSDVSDYQKPLFEFFKNIQLKGLSNSEIKLLLRKLAKLNDSEKKIDRILEEESGRVEILRLLTGGVTRTVVLLFNIFIDNINGNSIEDLQFTLDAVTPLYKHKMDDLSKQQQKIVDSVAKSWDATSVKEIVKKTRLESKLISSQLRLLEKNQIIEKIETNGKNHFYQINERFFNIWYLMRYGRKYDRKRLVWLVRFFESWFSREELERRISYHIDDLKNGGYNKNTALFLGEAFVGCNKVSLDLRTELVLKSQEVFSKEQTRGMGITDSDLIETSRLNYENENYELALGALNKVSRKDLFIKKLLTNIYLRMSDYTNALDIIDEILEIENEDDSLFIRANCLLELERHDEAIEQYKYLIERGNDEGYFLVGFTYHTIGENEKSEEYLIKALKFEETKSNALHYLGHVYEEKGEIDCAIKYMLDAVNEGKEGRIYLCLGRLYEINEDIENAKVFFEKAVEYDFDLASISLATLLISEDEVEKSDVVIRKILNSKNDLTQLNLGLYFYVLREDSKKAIFHYKKSSKLGNKIALHRLAHVYESIHEIQKAESYYLKCIKLDDEESNEVLVCLGKMYYKENIKTDKALKLIEKAYGLIEFDLEDYMTYCSLLLLDNRLDKSVEIFSEAFNEFREYIFDENEELSMYIIEYFIELMSYKYYGVALDLFEKYKLKDILKPVYFALMHYMKKEFPNEYLKIGSEIKEVVDGVIKSVEEGMVIRIGNN